MPFRGESVDVLACVILPPVCNVVAYMETASTSQALAAARQWLKPLSHVLIRCGVTWKEFAELSKTVYVEVATQQFGRQGSPANVSRTAVLTGLARRDVRKQRDLLSAGPEPLTGYVTKASLVLSAWHLDPEFLDSNGNPAPLRLDGDGATFAALLRRCGAGDLRPATLLNELRSAGAVRKTADGRLEALTRSYIPHTMDGELIALWGTVLADVGTTYVHNLTRETNAPARFERAAVNDRVLASALPEFQDFLNQEGEAFLKRIDAWLTAHEAQGGEDSRNVTVRLGAGLYQIQDPSPNK
jgi:hypothetical protein